MTNPLLLTNATIIDGVDNRPRPEQSILVVDDRIEWIGPSSEAPRTDVRERDLTGHTVLPGFFDCHVHFHSDGTLNPADRLHEPASLANFKAVKSMKATLDAGVTTARDLAGVDYAAVMAVQRGYIQGPNLVIARLPVGPTGGHSDSRTLSVPINDYGPGPYPEMIADSPYEARRFAREMMRVGAGVIKVMATGGVWSPRDSPEHTGMPEEDMRAIVEEASSRGIYVAAHAQGAEGIKNALRAGVKSIEHGYLIDDEGIELMLEHDAWLVPTLLTGTTPPDPMKATPYAVEKKNRVRAQLQVNIARAIAAGVKVAMGTDSGVVPHGQNLRELGLMVELGLSPERAITAGTIEAAKLLGMAESRGSIEVGKMADLVVTPVDPIADIAKLGEPDSIVTVIQSGRIVKEIKA